MSKQTVSYGLENALGYTTGRARDLNVIIAVSGSDPAAGRTDSRADLAPLTALVLSLETSLGLLGIFLKKQRPTSIPLNTIDVTSPVVFSTANDPLK